MTRGETTKFLSDLAEKLINPHNDPRIYWAREVTFDYATTPCGKGGLHEVQTGK